MSSSFFKDASRLPQDPRIARVSKATFKFVSPDFGPNPGPGHLPLDSGRGDIEFAGVFVSVKSVAFSWVFELIFWNFVKTTTMPRTRPGDMFE